MPPRVEVVRQPFALPPPPDGRFVVLDVAFAGGNALEKTTAFIAGAGERLRLWVDHHEHALGWPSFQSDPRFVLVSSRLAHACPELVTPEVVDRAGEVDTILAHHDFDGLMSAAQFLRGGLEPYLGADEDARAADSPGRGHLLSPRGARLTAAISEAGADLEDPAFFDFCRAVVASLVEESETSSLKQRIDQYEGDARRVDERAVVLAETRKKEAPGVSVLRLDAQLDGRMRRAVLSILEAESAIGLVLEGTPKRYWATAATYADSVALEDAPDLDRGRHDFRFGPTKDAQRLIAKLSQLARDAGMA